MELPPLKENDICPSCEIGIMLLRHSKFGEFLGCSDYPSCQYTRTIKRPTNPIEEAANKLLGEKPI